MARRLRIQFPGAIYHVINRGNYRRDVFESAGAAKAFEITLDEVCQRFRWRLAAYAILRNHFHLAIETVEPNLVDGMHWLQSTFATRFNRLRSEQGHLFQGRYQSLLVEDASALARVVNYIHLNPVRAGIVPASQVGTFRWSSLMRYLKRDRPAWFASEEWLGSLGWIDSPGGWTSYLSSLVSVGADSQRLQEEGTQLSRGWAIGTAGWRQAIARDHVHLKLSSGVAADEIRGLNEAKWQHALKVTLKTFGKTEADVAAAGKGVEWKLQMATILRREAGVRHAWIARELRMGSVNSLRSYLSRRRTELNQQTSA